jgi:hypothetical protein
MHQSRRTSPAYILASFRTQSPACIPGVYPPTCIPRRVCTPSFIRHPILSTSSVLSYLRSNLTADSRTSLVPAIFHFYSLFYYIPFLDVREIYDLHCILSYCVSFTIHLAIMHQSGDHPRRPSPACIRAQLRHPIRSTSSVLSYLRSYLTADSRTSPVPAISHFFIHFYYFIIMMFERFMNCIVSFHIVCRLRYTASGTQSCIHPAFILSASRRMSCVCPVYVLGISGTQSFLSSSVLSYLRSNLTADSRTSLVPAISHFYSLFYYFHLQMFERFMICIVSFYIVCLL